MKPGFLAFTVKSGGGPLREIRTKCSVSIAYEPTSIPEAQRPPFQIFNALWDTGASVSSIDRRVISALGLGQLGPAKSITANGTLDTERYLVNLRLPNNAAIANLPVIRNDLGPSLDVLIGMDVMTMGDVALTNVGHQTIFTFRIPSMKAVDFVQEAILAGHPVAGSVEAFSGLAGRNDPCPCGSGRKFKKCHGAAA